MAPWNVCMSCSILEANRNILSLCFIHELARGLQHSFPLQLSTVAHGVMSGRKKKEESDKQSIRELQNVVVMDKSDGVTCTKTNLASSSLQMSTTAANTLHPGINLLLENLHPIRTMWSMRSCQALKSLHLHQNPPRQKTFKNGAAHAHIPGYQRGYDMKGDQQHPYEGSCRLFASAYSSLSLEPAQMDSYNLEANQNRTLFS
ncbi:uncharacterized protein LOC133652263 isoform X2 [Entelurus aequoreus]|uniref:uncharacterized protein LOC133652263 isoform X2 n=1 Tax=Entelurus aequoreus TaxID=161455 RepID=UPI002B1E0445|nr:uncharacterized protein LOC133652263 isoform X2 [Entelurus aequoreus]